MSDHYVEEQHARDHTSGSSQRSAHVLARPLLTFDLAAEAEQLSREPDPHRHGHKAKTLVKEPTLRIVLLVLQSGARINEHRTDSWISIQALRGRLRVETPGDNVDLPAGHLLSLESGIPHAVEALAESAFLLTTTAPAQGGAELAEGETA